MLWGGQVEHQGGIHQETTQLVALGLNFCSVHSCLLIAGLRNCLAVVPFDVSGSPGPRRDASANNRKASHPVVPEQELPGACRSAALCQAMAQAWPDRASCALPTSDSTTSRSSGHRLLAQSE